MSDTTDVGEKCIHDGADLEVVSNCGVSSYGVPGTLVLGGGGGGNGGADCREDGSGPMTLSLLEGSAPSDAARSGGPDAIGDGTAAARGAGAEDLLR